MHTLQDFVFWSAPTRLCSFREQVIAASAGGFTSMAIPPEVFSQAVESGLTATDMRHIAEDAGVPLRHLDTATDWTTPRCPPGAPPEMKARFDIPLQESLRICELLRLETILATGGFPPGSVPLQQQIDGFGRMCEAASGLWIDLEFMPLLGLSSLEQAWAIVNGANQPNSGLMIDTWHMCRTKADIELLATIPGERLRSLQIADGFIEVRGSDMVDDTLYHRAFPGEGEFPINRIVEVLVGKGELVRAGPEVFSAEANALTPAAAGARSGATARRTLSDVGCIVPGTSVGEMSSEKV
ncbi:sugar phosphate isomerase/epimerase family protein [Burkholderia multivorans]|uniref:sugar phosphate isomerase/epimerase family protein n=1 Tax=Burkholderia multivorans TaxID=87883 RepID=UPI0021C03A96|nr:sugar phosphate isomerase/epimerase [Burkholderia multivorans]